MLQNNQTPTQLEAACRATLANAQVRLEKWGVRNTPRGWNLVQEKVMSAMDRVWNAEPVDGDVLDLLRCQIPSCRYPFSSTNDDEKPYILHDRPELSICKACLDQNRDLDPSKRHQVLHDIDLAEGKWSLNEPLVRVVEYAFFFPSTIGVAKT